MTDRTQSSYSRVRKSNLNEDNFQMGDERGGSTSIIMNSGDGIMAQYLQNANPYQNNTTEQNQIQLEEYQNEYEHQQENPFLEYNNENYGNLDVENLEISFEDEVYNALGKSQKLRKSDQFSDRPLSNLDDPMIGIDIDEGHKNSEFNNITPLRETVKLSEHNKFTNSAFKGITQTLNFHDPSPKLDLGIEDNPDTHANLNNNYFDPAYQLDQDEIDKILQQNNVSPLRNAEIEQEQKDGQKLNLVSDFNFDFVDDDNVGEGQVFEEGTGEMNFKDEYGVDLVIAEDELFQNLEKRRQITLENQMETAQMNAQSNRVGNKKQTSSALGRYEGNNKEKKSLLSSSKKSKLSRLKQKNKLSFNDYYQLNNKTATNRNIITKQNSVISSGDSNRSDYKQQSYTVMETKSSNMKLDLLKKKMNSLKNDKKSNSIISQSTKAQDNDSKKFKFKRLELPDDNEDSISGDDKIHKQIPTEGSQKDNIVLHHYIPKFNEIQSKTQLDGKPSPYQPSKKQPENNKEGRNHKKINVQSFDSHISSNNQQSHNHNFKKQSKEPKTAKHYFSNNVTQDLIKEFKTYQTKSKDMISNQQQLAPTTSLKSNPYDKYKQKIVIESKLQNAPIIDIDQAEQIKFQKSTAKYGSNIRINENPSKMKVFPQHSQFQIHQKGTIKSIKVMEKQTLDTSKDDAKFIKEMSKMENKEKQLKTQIDKIHNQIEKRKKDEEAQQIKVQCLYQQKLDDIRKNEKKTSFNGSNLSQAINQSQIKDMKYENATRPKISSTKSTIEHNKIERDNSNKTDKTSVNQVKLKKDQSPDMKPGYQQLNRVNYAKIGINQTPKASFLSAKLNNQERPSKISRQGNMQDAFEPELKDHKSPGYIDKNGDPFTNIQAINKQNVKNQKLENKGTNFVINPNPTNFNGTDEDEGSLVRNEVCDKSHKKLNKNIQALRDQLNENSVKKTELSIERNPQMYKHDSQDDAKNENMNQSIISQKKFIYRPLTASLRPNNKQDESFQSNYPELGEQQQIMNEQSVNSSRLDLKMVAKSSSNRYTREDMMRLKQRVETVSPTKISAQNSLQPQNHLEIIQENSFINPQNLRDKDIKRVSFKDSSKELASQNTLKSTKEIRQDPIVNHNFKYNKDVAEMHLSNPNIVNRKSFEQTFNPKKDGKADEEGKQNQQKQQVRAQSVLQGYKDQIVSRKNKQHLQDRTIAVQSEQQLIDESKRKQYMRSMINTDSNNFKTSILKNATIEPVRIEKIDKNIQNQKINNYTLNETLKVKINQEESKREPRGAQDPNQTINSRDNKSLDKSGIDFLTEARDFTNIISNLKNLLQKGKLSSNSNKSFQTLEQRPSHVQSVNQSYATNSAGLHHKNNISMSQINHQTLEHNHFNQPRISLSSQGHYGKDLAVIHEVVQPYYSNKNQISCDISVVSNQVRPGSKLEERRKRDFDIKLQRDIKALENILTRKHQLQRLASEVSNERTSLNQSTIDGGVRPSSRSSSVQRPSTKLMTGQVTFGNSMIKNSNQTPRGQSFNISRKSTQNNFIAAQPTSENMGTLLQSIKEAEEQLELLKGESNQIEQQIGDLRRLRSPPK
ncbi:UNKNOWN [Stylonychia lemnae]|uniref:Uncharacterized protein n=1 Tax=Stylonychia lemnae TaxID=5949 RepID=A0A078A0P6_STYLE|nr:UNKNOWN [Stylonychia lemnae]|eukprot:CDW75776.1 UNKNOWN [Stylonychia lemnae]